MVTLTKSMLLYCSLLASGFYLINAQSLLQSLISDVDPCEEVCQKTYPSHTYDKSLSGDCCLRGCRLYSIIELVGEGSGINGTLQACFDNCHDAYPGEKEEASACILGCNSQQPFSNKLGRITDLDMANSDRDFAGMMYPFLYMHNMYSNMVDKVTHHMTVSWSFFMQDNTGRLVVIKSQPQVIDSDVQDFDDYSVMRGTSSVQGLETNLEPATHTATEMLRHSQMKSANSFVDDFGGELNAAETYWGQGPDPSANKDWLSCIAERTGVPRLMLCVIILLSAVVMIWLCMSAAVTGPEQRLQKLSITGDLEYLRNLPEKRGIKNVLPQDFVEARPLPVKIKIQQI